MKKPILVAVSSQKGGVGKSTITVLLASCLHYLKGYEVAVIDCDPPQHSIARERERELRDCEQSEYLRKQVYDTFQKSQKRAYPVLECEISEALQTAQDYLDEYIPDFVFFDLPGTINNFNVIDVIRNVHYVFCPMTADRNVLESGIGFCNYVRESLITTGASTIKDLNVLWTMVDPRERTELYKVYDAFMAELNINVMMSTLPNSVRFRREGSCEVKRAIFRSTLMPPDRTQMKGSGIEQLVTEFLEITTK